MRRLILLMLFISSIHFASAQGYNHTWLLGYSNNLTKARIDFNSNSFNLLIDQRKMLFQSTQGNISDSFGNFLMSSNGVWIANSLKDTMLHGSGLNPGGITNNWQSGLPLPNANIFIPFPGDNNKILLFHHTATFNGLYSPTYIIYKSVIDLTGDNGLGEVILKNDAILQDTLNYGLAACKHANGRDWWIVVSKDSSNILYSILVTPNGIDTVIQNDFNILPLIWGGSSQLVFSPDGKKFAYTGSIYNNGNYLLDLRIFDFNRCIGTFSNPLKVNIDTGSAGFGVAFSPNSKYVYCSTFQKVFQINTDTTDITSSVKTVAVNDGFYSPNPPFQTDFWLMYLAANGKIYLTSGNSVQHIHYINNPDLDGLACDVNQHGLDLNGIWNLRSVPNHPNYYLGCDTTLGCTPCLVSVSEIEHDFRFNIYPNPSDGNFNIIYLLPQNKEGKLEVFDITGKVVYEMRLPQWSTLQSISLPSYVSNGLYNCVITSDNHRVSKKIAIQR